MNVSEEGIDRFQAFRGQRYNDAPRIMSVLPFGGQTKLANYVNPSKRCRWWNVCHVAQPGNCQVILIQMTEIEFEDHNECGIIDQILCDERFATLSDLHESINEPARIVFE